MTADDIIAIEVARGAGEVLRRVRNEVVSRTTGTVDQRELRDRGDAAAQQFIAARLAERCPDDAVLSEEAADAAGSGGRADRLAAERVWIIDPLDGTREYAEGRADWAVHVALWQRAGTGPLAEGAGSRADRESEADELAVDAAAGMSGSVSNSAGPAGELTVGAVALPDEGMVISSGAPSPLPVRAAGPLRIAVSRTRPPAIVGAVVAELARIGREVELVPMGSAGVKIAAVARGLVDAYVHGGGQYQWDSAAPVAAARAHGLWTSRLDGTPLVYNAAEVWLPDLLVCRAEDADVLLAAIRGAC